jgi:hypothetical protein
MKYAKFLVVLAFALNGAVTMAADCMITTTRTACPGREKESYVKCPNGAQSCVATVQATDEKTCALAAIEACLNTRFDVTKYKHVSAKFNKADFSRGQDFCNRDADYAKGKYVVRDNFPFRDKADCK